MSLAGPSPCCDGCFDPMQRPKAKARKKTVRVRERTGRKAGCGCIPRRYSKLALNCSKEIPKHSPFSRPNAFKDLREKKKQNEKMGNTIIAMPSLPIRKGICAIQIRVLLPSSIIKGPPLPLSSRRHFHSITQAIS